MDGPDTFGSASQAGPAIPRVLIGARALAGYIFGDEEKWRSVYPLKEELGLFRLRGQVCGRPTTIDARLAAREAEAAARDDAA